MQAIVSLNSSTGKWEGAAGNRVICKSVSKPYVIRMLEKQGHKVVEMDTPQAGAISMPKAEFSVEERFKFIEQFVKLVANKTMASLIITGSGGLGKTFTVINTLKKMGKKEDTIGSNGGDFITIKGFSTAKAMYRTLYENNGKIIIFDDADSVHKDPIGACILKAALESEPKRIISWGADFPDSETLPNRFDFHGQVIFISNLSLERFPQALLSRSMKVDLTLTTVEKVDRIETVFASKEINADADEKKEVLSFVKKHADRFTDLNIRSALNILKLRKSIVGSDWERIALYTAMA